MADRWQNRVAVVTGASAGIGAACVKYLAENGLITIGLARRKERIEALRADVKEDVRDRIHAIKCDVRNEEEIIQVFAEIEKTYGPVAVLVNNAGIVRTTELLREDNTNDLRDIINTNLFGVAFCTREALRSMKNGPDGHIFNINSIAGHHVIFFPGNSMNMYPASKYAVTAMTEVYRQELQAVAENVKITSISPGVVETEIFTPEHAEVLKGMPMLAANDIADALIYCLNTPPRVQIHELTIKPLGEKF